MGEIGPAQFSAIIEVLVVDEVPPQGVAVKTVEWPGGLVAVLFIGLRCQGAGHFVFGFVILQAGLDIGVVGDEPVRIKHQIVDGGRRVVAFCIAFDDIGLRLQAEPVIHETAGTHVSVAQHAAVARNRQCFLGSKGRLARDTLGHEIDHTPDVVRAVVNSDPAARHVDRFDRIDGQRK